MSGDTYSINHIYDAQAHVLSGDLKLPLVQKIEAQAHAKLPEKGGYFSEHLLDYQLEGVISIRKAYTQVAGHEDTKPGHGFSTLTTSVVEGLNVLNVVTADRVVAQIASEHPRDGYVPMFTFLGTHFDNLKIGGHPVRLHLDTELIGPKPENDGSYTRQAAFRDRVSAQYQNIRKNPDLPAEISERYNQLPSTSDEKESIECSLVHGVEGSFPGRRFGHVIDLPHFGKIYLATVKVEHWDWKEHTPKSTQVTLTMIEMKMGCFASGNATVGQTVTNGKGTG